MNLLKYAVKLAKMSPYEVGFRIQQKVRNSREQAKCRLHKNGTSPFVPSWIRDWDHKNHVFGTQDVKFFGFDSGSKELRNLYQSNFPSNVETARVEAGRVANHQLHLLGHEIELPAEINWNGNPLTGEAYPLDHFSAMDTFNTSRYGDVKYVWELNRHQFFVDLAKGYLISGDERYPKKIVEWLSSWAVQSPYKLGINHTSVLEQAVRIFAWIWAYYFTRESDAWSENALHLLAEQLLLQGQLIEENLSYYYSPYNHLIGELAALSFLGTVFPATDRLRQWRDHYWQEMELQLEKQFHSDGFTVEQASYYHHFTVGFYLQLAILRRQNGLKVSEKTWNCLERSLSFVLDLTRPDGQLPRIGDIDSARSIYLYRPDPMWDLRGFQALGAALFARPDMKYIAGNLHEELLWLMGPSGVESFGELDSTPPQLKERAYDESGYVIMRDDWGEAASYCCFDIGEIAHGVFKDETPSAAHGHADILSVEISISGRSLLVDPGFHTYFGDEEWHRYFRASRGHNTIEVNGAGQAVHEGRISWSNVSSPHKTEYAFGGKFSLASGSIDRFARQTEPIQHHRMVLFNKEKYILVLDEVSGQTNPADIISSFHFEGTDVVETDGKIVHSGSLVGLWTCNQAAEATVASGGKSPDQGWQADGYGQKAPATAFRIRVKSEAAVQLGLLLPLCSAEEFQLDILEANKFRVSYPNGNDTILWNHANRLIQVAETPIIETDAGCCVIVQEGDQKAYYEFIKVRHLSGSDYNLDFKDKLLDGVTLQISSEGSPQVQVWS